MSGRALVIKAEPIDERCPNKLDGRAWRAGRRLSLRSSNEFPKGACMRRRSGFVRNGIRS